MKTITICTFYKPYTLICNCSLVRYLLVISTGNLEFQLLFYCDQHIRTCLICLGKQVLIFLGIKSRISASKFPNPFSSAEVSLCRREAGEKENSKRAWQDGREKERKLPLFPSSHRPPRAYYFSIIAIFYWDTRQ